MHDSSRLRRGSLGAVCKCVCYRYNTGDLMLPIVALEQIRVVESSVGTASVH